MNKDRTYCTRGSCLTVTCSRHKKHLPQRYDKPLVWCGFEDCPLYTGFDKMPKRKRKLNDEEDLDGIF